jgi:hypothetical protein
MKTLKGAVASMKPNIDIVVDPDTGVWSSDGLPMIYAPRHWIVGINKEVEAALGREAFVSLMYRSSYRAAQHWCAQQAADFGITGLDLFRRYLSKSSERGLAQFSLLDDGLNAGSLKVEVRNSCYVLHHRQFAEGALCESTQCFAFAGSFAGAANWLAKSNGMEEVFRGVERECAAVTGAETCLLEIGRH